MQIIFFQDSQVPNSLILNQIKQIDGQVIISEDAKEAEQLLNESGTSILIIEIGSAPFDFSVFDHYKSDKNSRILFLVQAANTAAIDHAEKISPFILVTNSLDEKLLYTTLRLVIRSAKFVAQKNHKNRRLELMESVVKNAKDAIVITEAEPFDEPGPRIVFVNDAFTKMTGYSSEEALGRSPRFLQGPESDTEELQRLGASLRNWQSTEVTLRNYKKDGTPFWTNMLISPIADENGWFVNWISIQRDVSESKQKEILLKASEKRYRGLLDNLHAGVVLHAADTSIIISNTKASEILGLSSDQLAGKKAFDPYWKFVCVNGDALPIEKYPVNRIISTREIIKDLVLGVVKNLEGEITWVLVNGLPIFSEDNELIEVTITFVDITAQREAENVIKKSLDEKTMLMQEIHHRVKNNILSIEGFLLLQLRDQDSDEISEALNMTLGRVKSMRILYEMLTGKDSHKKVVLSNYVWSLATTVVGLYPGDDQIKLELDLPKIEVDTSQIFPVGIVINELITNSIKYATDKLDSLIINIRASETNDSINLTVSDNGPGIDPNRNVNKSTQVGLVLIKTLTRQIGGTMEYSYENGAVFKLTFPKERLLV
ncbi:MAG: PAS domain S-box protein [Cyclobacteriaceae bacterium]